MNNRVAVIFRNSLPRVKFGSRRNLFTSIATVSG
jgi:hypothetical protein